MILNTKSVFLGCFSLIFLTLLSSCSKTHYVIKQGVGQVKLLTTARDNEEVLKDVKVKEEYKDKIRKIRKYKEYFYKYFDQKTQSIYSKTTFLNQRAVTYLVISSPKNKIEAIKECFPIMGCFPYLGFYSEQDAKSYADRKEEEGFITYTRDVYAYSTLGYFTDPILSSFFYYSDQRLAELVFHELFHTIFFIKNEVDLNENLANIVGKEMMIEYFEFDKDQKKKLLKEEDNRVQISLYINKKVKELNEHYKKGKKFEVFMKDNFYPGLKSLCQKLKASCKHYESGWNNARFAAYQTYEKKTSKLKKLKKGKTIGEFYSFIKLKYKNFQEADIEGKFETYLLGL